MQKILMYVILVLFAVVMFVSGMGFGYSRAIEKAEPFIEGGQQFIDYEGQVHWYGEAVVKD